MLTTTGMEGMWQADEKLLFLFRNSPLELKVCKVYQVHKVKTKRHPKGGFFVGFCYNFTSWGSHRLVVRTQGSHPCNGSSTLPGITN